MATGGNGGGGIFPEDVASTTGPLPVGAITGDWVEQPAKTSATKTIAMRTDALAVVAFAHILSASYVKCCSPSTFSFLVELQRVFCVPGHARENRLRYGIGPMKLNNILVAASFIWLLIAFWNRNELPGNIDYVPAILGEPKQTATAKDAFDVVYNDVEYLVEPEYAYDITGMIVSYRHHDNNSRMHRLANDHLNMLDVCVVWGDNTVSAQLTKLDFWNGIFTCNVHTRDQAAWDSFDMYQLSNNHLISDDEYVRDRVKDIRVGDQVRVQRPH